MDLGEVIPLSEFSNVVNTLADLILSSFNVILKIFFNDIRVFGVGIGYIFIAIFILSAVSHTLLGNATND